jgi:LytS/YehU family sensor histidine kinase
VTISSRLRHPDTSRAAADPPPGAELVVVVTDTGSGAAGRDRRIEGEGVGLANVQRRLALAYGPLASLRFEPEEGRGARVEVCLPVTGAVHAPAGPEVASEMTS